MRNYKKPDIACFFASEEFLSNRKGILTNIIFPDFLLLSIYPLWERSQTKYVEYVIL